MNAAGNGFQSADPNTNHAVVCEYNAGMSTPTATASPSPSLASKTPTYSRTPSPSPSGPCPIGWTFYDDSNAADVDREGHNSCLKVVNAPGVKQSAAETACVALATGSQLLTIGSVNSSFATSGLLTLAASLSSGAGGPGYYLWIGGQRASILNRWTWIDGTDAKILNCGWFGCGVWQPNQPAITLNGLGAALQASGITAVDPNQNHGYICEIDIGPSTPTASITPTPSPTPSVSPLPGECPPGWTLYNDTLVPSIYQEGHSSCVLAVDSGHLSWTAAEAACAAAAPYARLLTINNVNSTGANSGLFAAAWLLGNQISWTWIGWIGATRPTGTSPWVYADDSPADILNCGSTGCGMWQDGQPGYVALEWFVRMDGVVVRIRHPRVVVREVCGVSMEGLLLTTPRVVVLFCPGPPTWPRYCQSRSISGRA